MSVADIYPIVYFDCLVVKVRQDKQVINKAVYLALGAGINNSCKYVSYKDRKKVCADLKNIYSASTTDSALTT